jgi:hypothetical protein
VEEKGTGSRYGSGSRGVPHRGTYGRSGSGHGGRGGWVGRAGYSYYAVLRRPKQKILNHSKCEISITLAFTFRFSIYFLLSRILPDNLLLFVILKKILVPIPTARRQGYKV